MNYWRRRVEAKVGKKFGKWEILAYAGTNGHRSFVKARCTCGAVRVVQMGNIVARTSKGCKACMPAPNLKHGNARRGARSPEWRAWRQMRVQCYLKTSKSYPWVGGRGIKIYKHWDNFETFFKSMGRKPEGTVLSRIDTRGNFVPGNTVWMPRLVQKQRLAAHMNAVRAAKKVA